MRDMHDLLEAYQNQNGMHSFEGDSGLDKLTKLLRALGYRGHSFKYGTPIEAFLSDNSGAVEAILNWIAERNETEWCEALESELPPEDEEAEDFDDESCPSCGSRPGDGLTDGCNDAVGCGFFRAIIAEAHENL